MSKSENLLIDKVVELELKNKTLSRKNADLERDLQFLKMKVSNEAFIEIPEIDEESVSFADLFDLSDIQAMQDAFAQATGVASIITFPDGRPITKPSNFCDLCNNVIRRTDIGLANCYKSDAEIGALCHTGPKVQRCLSGGLWDGGAGISVGNRPIANWLVGQILDEQTNEADMLKYADEIHADKERFSKALSKVTRMPKSRFDQICNFLFITANMLSKLAMQNRHLSKLISEKQKFQTALIKSAENFRNLFENANDGIVVTQDNKIIFANPRVFERKYKGIRTLDPFSFIYFEDREKVISNYRNRIAGEKIEQHYRVRIVTDDDQVRWVMLSSVITRWHGKDALLTFFTDIHDRMLAEERILKLNEELEQKVIDRTTELNSALTKIEESNLELKELNENIAHEAQKLSELNEKLSASESELSAANRTKDLFFSILAHDMKNPITGIMLATDLLKLHFHNMNGEQIDDKITVINTSAKLLNDFLNNLLEWARSQTGNIKFEPTTIDLRDTASECIDYAHISAESKAITINNLVEPNSMVSGDRNMITTIIRNLLSNAIKFTPISGSISVISTYKDSMLRLSVIDNGIGIDSNMLDDLFKLDRQRTTKGTKGEIGTGLGLIICKEFIKMHNGDLHAKSIKGKGTTIVVSLPVENSI